MAWVASTLVSQIINKNIKNLTLAYEFFILKNLTSKEYGFYMHSSCNKFLVALVVKWFTSSNTVIMVFFFFFKSHI
jgi:hypothetical protein